MITIGVTGGRDFTDAQLMAAEVNRILKHYGKHKVCFVAGGAPGLDTMVANYCDMIGVACAVYKAPWRAFDNAAGRIRNRWMLTFGRIDCLLSFPGGHGTAHMTKICKQAGIPVYMIRRK